ncbi:hypothetical protein CCR85_06060 [Rhodothalassium salexigens]|uniref:Flagellin n=1 Tax=Rhodothalassium salexigens DSM 2132 TaxID=1188247 RepID=A0A4R2P5L6_RHOSA|nr:flagellin [Rhodothalassium salexigens]MBB4212748.1 flagellin [Rhodothalassium salexigens DSM 2132]MBK1640139.1 hypothetical protein [Rhodothalassium salexigens DSM 2132]MBK5911054.1 hypothetical protein [Rhodothalassium salexigens]MBK5920141.1 hypothetical protein [Rhodothalassium salexigens]TCP30149.1 flagellin [Rhodothalassium salexigens DSM 2132]
MAFSINTNPQAFVALQNNAETSRSLATTQNRIATGLEVAGAEDDSASFTIAQRIRSQVGGLNAVSDSLSRASSTLDVALNASETISDLLVEARELATAASDGGLTTADRAALSKDFDSILTQITNTANSAEFNGVNVLSDGSTGNGDNLNALTSLSGGAGTTIDFTGTNLTTGGSSGLNISQLEGSETTASAAQAAITEITNALSTVNTVLADLGAAANQVELQSTFVSGLQDSLEVGIGNLVDANLAEESARLTALQTQQQLGLSALAIANQQPQSILSLF